MKKYTRIEEKKKEKKEGRKEESKEYKMIPAQHWEPVHLLYTVQPIFLRGDLIVGWK